MKFENGNLSMVQFFEKMNQLVEDADSDDESDIENEDDCENDALCMICIMNNKSTLLEPCNNLKFCEGCVQTLLIPTLNDEGNHVTPTCPECQSEITGHRLVFL